MGDDSLCHESGRRKVSRTLKMNAQLINIVDIAGAILGNATMTELAKIYIR
jgi:hypothetical protein